MHDLFDQYSILHFATGVTAYFWGLGPWGWFFTHLAWEGFENSAVGIQMVNKYWFWPRRKCKFVQDSISNTVGDNISAHAGYWCAKWLDEYGKDHGWYGEKPET